MEGMGIDDILASVDRDDFSSPEATAVDHQQLTRFWVAERAVPELLPWPGALMDRMMERVSKQISKIEDLSMAAADPLSPENNNQNKPTLNLKLSIMQSDLARTQYIIRSILRQRLSKLIKYSIYYLRISMNQDTQTPAGTDAASLLSEKELQFLRGHQSLLTTHYNASFLSTFPPNLKRLDDNVGGTNMVVAPENKEVVFVRCLSDESRIVIPASEGEDGMAGLERYGGSMARGEVWVVRWEGVKDAWKRGDIEVL
ncbi:DNA replication complex GINS protein [Trichophyton mentagrophytes]|uniref:DNA replication complex GINS protein SLD5 n=1 Tax=Trichophyton interdigitale (strain MR816) TaxID=1215338 RepID=A0A059J9X5_TRIIM|nr:hypothetical protein H101_03916 [Trichophyton interdigitale H6]KAF3899766.1 DNA replication complex GINS protein SLD5 [Trichophyton interdigitale]KDB24493.1 hypothetical protein H109_03591 [Trichophyton interdigitale MR816]GBF65165.1 DNA replication complex GINS protein [Trichophyton mentagrophytes]KAG5218815.1 DNA replication complex GINS protein SLD5 [Trichophyton interdigitale]